jgi:uncharacterized membrane protein YgcG
MRKFFCIFLIFAACFTGCHKTNEESETIPVANDAGIMDAPETMPDLQTSSEPEMQTETLSIAERVSCLNSISNQHICDECHVLSEEEFQNQNEILEEFASSRNLNVFLVITDHLDGNTPQQFAETCYQAAVEEEYSGGMLILLNNDTNQDYIYLTGSCPAYITQVQIDAVLSGASYDLINQNYINALNLIYTLFDEIPC